MSVAPQSGVPVASRRPPNEGEAMRVAPAVVSRALMGRDGWLGGQPSRSGQGSAHYRFFLCTFKGIKIFPRSRRQDRIHSYIGRMDSVATTPPVSSIVAAALARTPRKRARKKGKNARNNFVAEGRNCGNAKGAGAPVGNHNAWQHRRYTTPWRAHRKTVRALIATSQALCAQIKALCDQDRASAAKAVPDA